MVGRARTRSNPGARRPASPSGKATRPCAWHSAPRRWTRHATKIAPRRCAPRVHQQHLAHDALLDEVDELLYEDVVEGHHQSAAVAATLRRLTLAAVTAATPQDWQHITERLIADVRELEADARHNPKTDPPRSPER